MEIPPNPLLMLTPEFFTSIFNLIEKGSIQLESKRRIVESLPDCDSCEKCSRCTRLDILLDVSNALELYKIQIILYKETVKKMLKYKKRLAPNKLNQRFNDLSALIGESAVDFAKKNQIAVEMIN